jgi:hypothetical protein
MLLMHSKRKPNRNCAAFIPLSAIRHTQNTIETVYICPKEWIDFFYNRAAVMAAFNTKIIGFV